MVIVAQPYYCQMCIRDSITHDAEERPVHERILHLQRQRRTLAAAEVFDIVLAPYGQGR